MDNLRTFGDFPYLTWNVTWQGGRTETIMIYGNCPRGTGLN